ncbi:TMEM175 family protein [Hymenobacter caeli]|uniref:Membrane protein n=1 Tax=Hymenobacter caeli TaxID=2735894 RepID=A0ABX2FQT8_9BACT|nr:TMEM175 family protein [Hymenobacter caeli]NRT18906.1 putative membrane protein [Hymenobacter caeli]
MPHHDTILVHHDRTEFQIERLILFTDAVFAIAITLLAIEIKLPEMEGRPTDDQVWQQLVRLIPKFIGFLTGFAVIALYWMAHHRIFRFLRNYDGKLLWLNTLFLLFIVLMPFSSGLFSSYATVRAPFAVYAANITLAALAQVWLMRYLANPAHGLIRPADATHPDLDWWRPLVPASGFLLALLVMQFVAHDSVLNYFTPFLLLVTIPLSRLHRHRYRRLQALHEARLAPQTATH